MDRAFEDAFAARCARARAAHRLEERLRDVRRELLRGRTGGCDLTEVYVHGLEMLPYELRTWPAALADTIRRMAR